MSWVLKQGENYLAIDAGLWTWESTVEKAFRLSRRADAESLSVIIDDADRIIQVEDTTELGRMENALSVCGLELKESGDLTVNMAKFNAVHRCAQHRKAPYQSQDLEHCVPCLIAEIARLK